MAHQLLFIYFIRLYRIEASGGNQGRSACLAIGKNSDAFKNKSKNDNVAKAR